MSLDRPFRSLSTGEKLALFVVSLKTLIPFLIAAVGFMVTTAPFFPPLPVVPNVGLLLVFLFALYRPTQLPVWGGVPLGVVADLMLGMPVGANALLLPLFMLAIIFVDTKTTRIHWLADWILSVPFLIAYQFALWSLCVFAGPSTPILPFITQGAATIAAFPVVAFFFVSVQRRFVDKLSR